MNRILICLFALMLHLSLPAQDMAAARTAFETYTLNQENLSALREAIQHLQGEPVGIASDKPAYYLLKGKVFGEVANQMITRNQQGGSLTNFPQLAEPALNALEAFMQVLQLAKSSNIPNPEEVTAALNGLLEVRPQLHQFGIAAYEKANFHAAYENFNAGLSIEEIMKQNGKSDNLENPGSLQDQRYMTGMAALNARMPDAAQPLFEHLYQSNYDNPYIYEALYLILSTSNSDNSDAAYKYLTEGIQRYPMDTGLIFSEINHLLKTNKLDELVTLLNKAIEIEPENTPLQNTLANVYDNLSQREYALGNGETAEAYFSAALNAYELVVAKEPTNFDARYSLGSLHYNRAANMTLQLNNLAGDFSKQGIQKYEELKLLVFAEFEKALPHLQKAENLDPNDVNTLIALKEIYSRKDDMATSHEFSERLKKVMDGGSNGSPFFK